jgi:cyclase
MQFVKHQPAAHTDGDSLVYFRRSDVLFTGDLFDATRFPVIDLARGVSVQGLLDSLNAMVEMTCAPVPFPPREDGPIIVAGHGRVCGTTELIDYGDMVTIIRDAARLGLRSPGVAHDAVASEKQLQKHAGAREYRRTRADA